MYYNHEHEFQLNLVLKSEEKTLQNTSVNRFNMKLPCSILPYSLLPGVMINVNVNVSVYSLKSH